MAENDAFDEPSTTPEPETQPAPRQSTGATLAEQAKSARPVRRPGSVPAQAAAASHRTGPVQFVQESVAELKKVHWPDAALVQRSFWAVLVFVLIIMAYVGLLDLGFGWLLLKLFG